MIRVWLPVVGSTCITASLVKSVMNSRPLDETMGPRVDERVELKVAEGSGLLDDGVPLLRAGSDKLWLPAGLLEEGNKRERPTPEYLGI